MTNKLVGDTMLQAISDIVKNVVIIILLTNFLDMLLPNNNMQRLIKVVMGLFVMLAILNPLIGILSDDYELSAWQLSTLPEHKVDTVLAQGQKIVNIQQEQAFLEYRKRIEKQMEALIKLIPNVGQVQCSVKVEPVNKVGAIGRIKYATVWVNPGENKTQFQLVKPVEPVNIQIGEKNEPVSRTQEKIYTQIKEKIINVISNYYSLEKENIEVIFY